MVKLSQDTVKTAEFFMSCIAVFSSGLFFINEEWKKVKGFENANKIEITMAFTHWWIHNQFHCYTTPCGMSWFSETTKESYNTYIKYFKPIFKAYQKWITEQR